jgi:hypothetical protein
MFIIAAPSLDTFSSSYSNPVAFALVEDLRPGGDDTTFILDRAISSEERAFLDASQCVVRRMSLEESEALILPASGSLPASGRASW